MAGSDVGPQLVKVGIGGVKGSGALGIAVAVDLGPRDAGGVLADLVGGCAALSDPVSEHHVDLLGFVQPHRDLDGE